MAFLKHNDTVAVVSPSGIIKNNQNVLNAIKLLKEWGLNVIQGNFIFNKYNFFAGTDQERFDDLQKFLDNEQIKAIFCTRGGYGLMRLLPNINLEHFHYYPKIVIGYSDITSLLNYIYKKTFFPSIHGLMLNSFFNDSTNKSIQFLYQILFENINIEYVLPYNEYNMFGTSEGILVGGNLSIIYSLQATPYEIDTYNKILFIEDINENIYHIERMLLNLKYSGKFENLKGLIIGEFINIKDTSPSFGMNVNEIIKNIIKDYNFPVIFNFPAGHGNINYPLIIGQKTTIISDKTYSKVILHNENQQF